MKLKVGDKVRVTAAYDNTADAFRNKVKCEGYTGELIHIKKDKHAMYPYHVRMDNKNKGIWVFRESELEVVND